MDREKEAPGEEPLDAWAARRDARCRPVGELRAFPLAEGPWRAEHVALDRPRLIAAWDGTGWAAVTIAADRQAACRILADADPDQAGAADSAAAPNTGPGSAAREPATGAGCGRHRKPQPGKDRR